MFFNKEYTVKLVAANGHYMDGVWKPNPSTATKKINASIQPASRSDYDALALRSDGARVEKAIRIYTETDLTQAGSAANGGGDGDRVVYNGEDYLVRDKSGWQGGVINHYRYLAVKT